MAYDYEELQLEINEEIEDLLLTPGDTIQILRAKAAIEGDYYPITDWYYIETIVMDDLIVEPDDSAEEIENKAEIRAHYMKDKPMLQEALVADVLLEMKQSNDVPKKPNTMRAFGESKMKGPTKKHKKK